MLLITGRHLQQGHEGVLHGFGEDVQLFIEQDKLKDNTLASTTFYISQ